MGNTRNSDGYRKNISKDGMRSPHLSEAISKKIDIIAKYKGINFTKACEEALEKYAEDYIESLDIIERTELLQMLWKNV